MNNPVRPDPDALSAFWRCLEETRAAIDVRERPVGAGFWWWYAFTDEHEVYDDRSFSSN